MNPIKAIRRVAGWTQRQIARAAGTSQPTIAAYESGAKSPSWSTIVRIAGAAGLAVYPVVGTPMTRDEARSLALHDEIAIRLIDDEKRVLAVARRNVARMLGANHHAAALLNEWTRILELPPTLIASAMLDPSSHGRDLRQVTPFAGVLNASERAAVYRSFRDAA